ncbi:damage-inducible protein DinB [candidate division KSB1 bacterium]|nr:damage-inducible protein DinB [candidate division KSB1 bacterium]NIR69164.1 damage-inducible protein DinB [candidate division KSB1 bacterium]NIS25675.1 damage-inducible protein DinB [candidate division KSB1 bacterium]NIT72543.1 damage-inducible protein DinB [candidate division KSB1 bacterium]NIU26352.1 damage-inducible protein DinB [candidate division KSB1 bacterium]
MKELLEHLFEHAHWANRRVLASLQAGSPSEDAVRLFAHVLTTERIYHERVSGKDPWPQDFWPELSLHECGEFVPGNHELYRSFFRVNSEKELHKPVRYRNSKGTVFYTPLRDMLMHLTLHGEHHRGQIARIVRGFGEKPAVTDFITFCREQD